MQNKNNPNNKVISLLKIFLKLFLINVLYPFFFRTVRQLFSLLEFSLKKVFFFYNGPTDNLKNDHLLRIESDFFGDERFAKEVTNFDHFDLYMRPRRWFRPLKELSTTKNRKEIFRTLLRSENQKRLLRSSFFLLKMENYSKIILPSLLIDQPQENLFFFQFDTLFFKVFLFRKSFFWQLLKEKLSFFFLFLTIEKIRYTIFVYIKKIFQKIYLIINNNLNIFFEKLKNIFLFIIIQLFFYKIIKGMKFFLIFFLRLIVFSFIFPLFLISFFITLFFSFIFFFDSILMRATPWILKKYPDDLAEDLYEPPLDGPRLEQIFKNVSFELKSQGSINNFLRSHKLLGKSSFIKDFFIYFLNVFKWYYLTTIKFLFLLKPGRENLGNFDYEAEEADEELEEIITTNLPLTDVDWWTDLFGIIRRFCVFFYIPIGILFFYIFINSFFVNIFVFFFFVLNFFVLYIYVLRIKFLKFLKFFVLIFIGNFTIRTLTNNLKLNASNIDENLEKIDKYYVTRGERRRIYYKRSLFLEDLGPFLKRIGEVEKSFLSDWNLILPVEFVSFITKFRYLDLKPNFEKFSQLINYYFKIFFDITKISNNFKMIIVNLYLLFFKYLFSKNIFSYIFVFSVRIFQIFIFFFLFIFSIFSIFFQFFFFNFLTLILKFLINIIFQIYFFFFKIFIYFNEFNLFYNLLFKFILLYKVSKINNMFVKFYYSRNIGFLRIIGILYSIIIKDNVNNNYKIFLKKWYNRFLFKNNEFYKFKEKKSSYVVSSFIRNVRKNKAFFKQRTKKKYLNDLNILFKTQDNEKKEILKALLINQLLQKKFTEKIKYYDWYFENFVFYKYKIHSQLSNFKSVSFNNLWDWVKNYKLNVDSVKILENSSLSQLIYRNNIPRLESSKIEFFLRNLFLYQKNQLNIFIFFFLFELLFYFFILTLYIKNVDLFVIFFIIFLRIFFFLPIILLYYFNYEKYIYRKFYVGNLLLIFKPINFKTISVLKFCIPGLLNKFIKLRVKCEFSYLKLNYLLNYKLTFIEILKDYVRFFFVIFIVICCYIYFFFQFFNFFYFFASLFFSLFLDAKQLIFIYFDVIKLVKEGFLNDKYNFLINLLKIFNLLNDLTIIESCFFFFIIIIYTILFYFIFKYLYFLLFFLIINNPVFITIFGNWIFLNVNPVFIINACLRKKFDLKNISKESIQIFNNMNYLPKVNLLNLEKELKLVHVTKYLSYHLLKKKI